MHSFKQIENRRKNISIYYESNLSIFENLNTNRIFYSKIKNFSRDKISRFNFCVISNRSKIERRTFRTAIYYESNPSIFENLNTNLFIITNKFYSKIKNFSRCEIGRFNFYSDLKQIETIIFRKNDTSSIIRFPKIRTSNYPTL